MSISRDTFVELKHYVGVRLQQGVPLVDADWNEQEDIRKYELRAFLKWFVGDGVPEGNDGFRIVSIVDKIILTSNKNDTGVSSIEVLDESSSAASKLGFGPGNNLASRAAPLAALLTGDNAGPFELADGMTLVISADDLPEETVTFHGSDFNDIRAATAAEVVAAIDSAMSNLTGSAGTGNDFNIKGGEGTAKGAGRCLVEGWDVINESYLKYTAQRLYKNGDLAAEWGVEPLNELVRPEEKKRIDLVYLDVWEREVDADEDSDLVNSAIGIETCVRLKREWVVRVKQGEEGGDEPELPDTLPKHVYYPLAYLTRTPVTQAIGSKDITDLRRTGVNLTALADEIEDARGTKGNLGNRLDVSLTPGGQLRDGAVSIAKLGTIVLDIPGVVVPRAEPPDVPVGLLPITIENADEYAFYLISVRYIPTPPFSVDFSMNFNWKRRVLFYRPPGSTFGQYQQLLIENPHTFPITVSCKVYRLNET